MLPLRCSRFSLDCLANKREQFGWTVSFPEGTMLQRFSLVLRGNIGGVKNVPKFSRRRFSIIKKLYRGFVSAAIRHAIAWNAAWYCWHASRRQMMLESIWNEFGAFVHQQIIWVKTRAVLTYSLYLWQHEPCLFGWIRGEKPKAFRAEVGERAGEFRQVVAVYIFSLNRAITFAISVKYR